MPHRVLTFILPFCLLMPGLVQAAGKGMETMRAEAASWLSGQAEQRHPEAVVEVEIGPVDSRLRLGNCNSFKFFLPASARLWGGGSLRAMCTAPAQWNLYLSYQIRLTGPALTARRPLPARQLLAVDDVALGPVHYAQSPGSYLREIPQGATTLRPLSAGQAIMIHDLNLPNVIQAGARIRVRVNGSGFSVAQEGKALNAARAGGDVQVKMPSGRIVRGIATTTGEVEIQP